MCEILLFLIFAAIFCGCPPISEFVVGIFGGCLLIIAATFGLFFFFVLLIEHPVFALMLLAVIGFTVYLAKQHKREAQKRAAELEIELENETIGAHQQYMTEYFEKRERILKQFNHLN